MVEHRCNEIAERTDALAFQGGFARCFQFRLLESGEELAGKVVAKESLTKERARLKVCASA